MTSKHLEHDINCLASGRQAPVLSVASVIPWGADRARPPGPGEPGAPLHWFRAETSPKAFAQARFYPLALCRMGKLQNKQKRLIIPNLKPVKNVNLHIHLLPYSLLLQ